MLSPFPAEKGRWFLVSLFHLPYLSSGMACLDSTAEAWLGLKRHKHTHMCSGVNPLLSKHPSADSPEEGSTEPSVVVFVIYGVPRHLCSPLDSRSPLEAQWRSNWLSHPKQHILTTWIKPFWLIISTLVDDLRVFVISVGVFITRQRGNWGRLVCQLAGIEKKNMQTTLRSGIMIHTLHKLHR